MRSLFRFVPLLLSLAAPAPVRAQASATITSGSVVHRDVDRLVAQGLLDTLIVGQRPYSRMSVARAVVAASRGLARIDTANAARAAVASEILTRLRHEVSAELRSPDSAGHSAAPMLRRQTVDLAWLGMPWRAAPLDNGVGSIRASVNPLAPTRGEWAPVPGVGAVVEPLAEWRPARWLALAMQPQLMAASGAGGMASIEAARAFARVVAGPIALQVGRDQLAWGQGVAGGSLLAADAPALDMVLLATDRSIVLPWLLRYIGPVGAAFYVARLDGGQNYPHPYLAGYKASLQPARWLELGAAVHVKGGGEGGPEATFAQRVADLFPLYDVLFKGDDDFQFSDKYAGLDGRLRLPAGGAELYGEVMLNDLDFNRLASSFGEDAAHVVGLWLPRLDGAGRLEGTLEWRQTGIRQFRHHQFTSGMTLRGRLLGDPLGPDARGAFASLSWSPSTWRRFSLDGALEGRRAHEYTDVTGGAATIDFERTETRPVERRARLVAGIETAGADGRLRLGVQAGVERAANWNFTDGAHRTGGLGRVTLTWVPAGP